jgi:hypothetical protein
MSDQFAELTLCAVSDQGRNQEENTGLGGHGDELTSEKGYRDGVGIEGP